MERPASRRRNRSQRQLSPLDPNNPQEGDADADTDTLEDENAPLQEKKQESPTRLFLFSRLSIFLLICCISTLVAFLYLLGKWQHLTPALHVSSGNSLNYSSTISPSEWELHPEDHALRAPTTIRLNWNITSEYRRPDGVKKLTYLINGIMAYFSQAVVFARL